MFINNNPSFFPVANIASDLFANDVFLSILIAGAFSQILKIIITTVKHKQKFSFNDIIVTGGMPSTHSALVSSLATIIFLEQGLSALFFVVLTFSLELLPRITRAQSMDVLSSQASIAGYKAVILAANLVPKLYPMMMTAAGTITAAKVFVIGAGVAGLQAIATARRLGAVVKATDVRSAAKENVFSLGAKFIDMGVEDAAGAGGYAKGMDADFYRHQQAALAPTIAESDVIITTAAVPGKKAPLLISAEAVRSMSPGSIVIDLAAEQGGNCELTKPNETVVENGVSVIGCVNLAATVPFHASQMFSRNATAFLLSLVKDGRWAIDRDDEIVQGTLITADGQVVHPQVHELLGQDAGER
jgi:NAD(P) transhydrogenase subunit alpha